LVYSIVIVLNKIFNFESILGRIKATQLHICSLMESIAMSVAEKEPRRKLWCRKWG